MSATAWWSQTVLVAIVVASALVVALRRLAPTPARRVQARVVEILSRLPLPNLLRVVVLRAQPKATTGASCGDGCSACGGCAVAKTISARPADDTQSIDGVHPLRFRPRVPTPRP